MTTEKNAQEKHAASEDASKRKEVTIKFGNADLYDCSQRKYSGADHGKFGYLCGKPAGGHLGRHHRNRSSCFAVFYCHIVDYHIAESADKKSVCAGDFKWDQAEHYRDYTRHRQLYDDK